MNNTSKVKLISKEFDILYGNAECSLIYGDALQLLVATQLSAQCTDKRVNIVTRELFKKYKNAVDYANADFEVFAIDIKSTGFYNNKAKNIIACCKMILERFGGGVPNNMADLTALPGVGRKTANLILGEIFRIPGVVVDTHAKRLSNRIGLSANKNPEKIEYDLMKTVPKEKWTIFSHQLVYHGRQICIARKPLCERCTIRTMCNYFKTNLKSYE